MSEDGKIAKHPGGRPRKEVDYKLVEKLSGIHCTQEEIAGVLGLNVRTLQRNKEFCRIYKNGLDKGRISLRRMQFQKAMNGDTSMLIWLGKQLLGQIDHIKNNLEVNQPIKLIVDDTDLKA